MKQNKVIKAGIWYTICNFLVKGLTFITMPIFTRILSSNDIGYFSNITSWFGILSIITTFEMYSSINIARFKYKKDLDSYISSNLFLGTLMTLVIYIIVLIFKNFFVKFFGMSFLYINILFIYLLSYPAIEMLQVKNRITYNYKSTIFISLFSSITSTIISIIFVFIFKDKLLGRVLGNYIPMILISVSVYVLLLIKGKSISPKYWKFAITISFPLMFHLLANNLLNSSDRIMITNIIGPSATAKYSVAYSCSMILSILWSSMNSAWGPWAYEMMEIKNYTKLNRASKLYFLFFCFIAIIFALFAPEILYILGGDKYMTAVYVLPPVILGCVFQFVYSFYINIEYFNKKQKYISISTIFAALINIILNLVFIPKFGYVAAAYTTLIGYILLFICHYFVVKKLKLKNCYDIKFFIICLSVITIFFIFCGLLYKYSVVRYIFLSFFLLIIVTFFIKMKNEIIICIKGKKLEPILVKLRR